MAVDSPLWRQFRRLLLGAVVESLLAEGVGVVFSSIHIHFSDESAFRVPRLDNYMRFAGELSATLAAPPAPHAVEALARRLRGLWPELLGIIELPIGDTLTNEHMHLDVIVDGDTLRVRFDLAAD